MGRVSAHDSRLVNGAELDLNVETPLLADGIHREGVGVIFAPAQTGKTPVVLDLALAVANGLDTWASSQIYRHGHVVYYAIEGGSVFFSYLRSWLEAHPGSTLEKMWIADQPEDVSLITLLDPDSRRPQWVMDETVALDIMKSLPENPALIVLDTQVDVLGDANENDNVDMRALYAAAKNLAKRLDCFVMFVHHTGRSGAYRGASSQEGKADVRIELEKGERRGDGTLTHLKNKGIIEPDPVDYCMESLSGSVHVRWKNTVADFAEKANTSKQAKYHATEDFIVSLVGTDSDAMLNGRRSGWTSTEVRTAVVDHVAESGDDLFTAKGVIINVLDRLQEEGRVKNVARSKVTGSTREWISS